tara:strand:- start:4392 stop:6029 length:1638 start_codon:yes stop_codon:yes gene_type:complete
MESNKGLLQVLFADSDHVPLTGQVIISPVNSRGWNDFGYHIKCIFKVCVSDDVEPIEGDMLIGFLPPKEVIKSELDEWRPSLGELMKDSGKSAPTPEHLPPFFTLLPDLKSYRYVVESLGPQHAEVFLKSVNDLVVFKEEKDDWITKALTTEVFSRGFMRNSEPFFAYNNADSVLGGVDEEDFSAISNSLDLSFSLEGFQNPHEIKLRFSDQGLIPRRINVLIGKNGLGKSQALKYFCRAALRYQDKHLSLSDTENIDSRPMISRVLAVATPGETQNTFPAERIQSQKLFYRRLNLTRNSKSKVSRSIGETLVQLARSEEYIGENERWDLFLEALQKSIPVDSLIIPLNGGKHIPLKRFSRGSEQEKLDRWASVDPKTEPRLKISDNTYPLSSGQLTFFKFALLCCLYIENGSFVLMDEPETHLHPNMISDFVELLDYLLEHTGSHAILATHSAYFVREVPKEQVHVFQQQDDGGISIDQPRLRTFGASVDSISQFVFCENSEIRLTDKIYEKVKGRTFEDIDAELSDQLSLAALMHLRRKIEAV